MSSPRELLLPSAGTLLKDDFVSNDVVTDNGVGELGWQIATIGNASTLAYQTQTPHGVLRLTTAATADGDGEALHLFPDGLVINPGVEFGARVRLVTAVTSSFRVGLDDSVTATSPTVGIWFDCAQGVMSCQVDSADHGDEAVSVAGHADLTSGTTLVAGEWVDLKAVCHGDANAQGGPSQVDFYINQVLVAQVPCNIDDDEEVEPKIAHWQATGGAAARIFEIDYFWLWIPRTSYS